MQVTDTIPEQIHPAHQTSRLIDMKELVEGVVKAVAGTYSATSCKHSSR